MSLFVEELIVYLIYISSNLVSMILLCRATMKKRHPLTVWIVYIVVKTIIVNIVFRMFCDELIRTNEIMRGIYLTLVSIFAILTYVVILYTFNEEFSKIAVISVCAEMVAVGVGYLSKAVTNILMGESPFSENAPLHIMDFVSAVLTILFTLGLLKVVRKWIKKIHMWEVVRKKTVMTLFGFYMMFSVISMYFSFERMILLDGVTSVVFSTVLIVQFVNYFHRETLWENDLLKKRQRLVRMQYEGIVLQMKKMEQMHKEIQTQMQTILKLSEGNENKTEYVERYIFSLKQHSENITEGFFCNDWFLDSVLHGAKKKCEEKGIQVEFYLQGYQKAGVHSEKLASDVRQLLDLAIENASREIFLKIANVKGQLIIKWEIDGKEQSVMWT